MGEKVHQHHAKKNKGEVDFQCCFVQTPKYTSSQDKVVSAKILLLLTEQCGGPGSVLENCYAK